MIKNSIIIPSVKFELLEKSMKTLLQFTSFEENEIIVVINSVDHEKYVKYLDELSVKNISYIVKKHPCGYTKSINLGAKKARGLRLILFNDDNELLMQDKDLWIHKLEDPFIKESNIGVTGIISNYIPNFKFLVFFCVMIDKKVFDILGGLDEIFNPGGAEDVDFCKRVNSIGYKNIQVIKDGDNSFPIYHSAEGTVHDLKENEWDSNFDVKSWAEVKTRNRQILSDRYDKPLISVVVPLHKGGKLEDNFLKRLTEQSYKNFELIIYEDINKDGASYARNRGLEQAKGDYIFFSDADVRWSDDILNKLIQPFSNPKIDFTYPNNIIYHFKNGKQYGYHYVGGDWYKLDFTTGQIVGTSHLMIKRESVVTWDENIIRHNDNDYYIQLKDNNKFGFFVKDSVIESDFDNSGISSIYSSHYWKSYLRKKHAKFLMENEINKLAGLRTELPRADVTVVIPTRNRLFTTLPLTLVAIANQSVLPAKILIYNDGDEVDLRKEELYANIFALLNKKGIECFIQNTKGVGQVKNHHASINDAKTKWIWRVDDDNIPQTDVLEILLMNVVSDKIGAVGGLIFDPKNNFRYNKYSSSSIKHVKHLQNIQWSFPLAQHIKSVDHIYSSFIYRVDIAKEVEGYCTDLSQVGHREETIFSYKIKRAGYDLIIDPRAISWHFRYSSGGIRDKSKNEMWAADEKIFDKLLQDWDIKLEDPMSGTFFAVLNNGLGDHIVFRSILPEIRKAHPGKKLVVASCYTDVFEDEPDIDKISIDEASSILGDIKKYSIYDWMVKAGWKGDLRNAFKKLYNV